MLKKNKRMKTWKKVAFPFSLAFILAIGILIGNFLAMRNDIGNTLDIFRSLNLDKSKISELLNLINYRYVDSVNMNAITDNAMTSIVANLDPHSVYIPAKDLAATNEELEGKFGGIGVEFTLQNDTIMVVNVVHGGPSEKVGILPGDKIITVNDTVFAGKAISNQKVLNKLRGKSGTTVQLGIRRPGRRDLLKYVVTRGEIPVKSVDAAYMITPQIGYIKVSKFGDTTYSEFLTALAMLRSQGATKYIIDLRDNMGGFMDAAVKMVDEFLPKNELIVYAEGRAYPKTAFYSDGRGSFQTAKIAVLINEWTASAAEIFSGAIQDNDRGLIIGIRSYGKGLVQQQFEFPDKSAVRLTIARYYTPSGRCIQKPYQLGKDQAYDTDFLNRYARGEFFHKDSVKLDKAEKFKTLSGRTVYGGGGIMPDIFVPLDTTGYTPYYRRLIDHGILFQFAIKYTNEHRAQMAKYKTWQQLNQYLDKQPITQEMAIYGAQKGIPKHYYYFGISHELLKNQLKAYIMRNMLGDSDFYHTLNQDDNTVHKAVEVLTQ
jgi:carboxyl-terminal processing protease